MLQVDRFFFPLLFVEYISQHHYSGKHEEEHAKYVGPVHTDDQEGERNAPEHEHQRMHHGHVPFMIQLEPVI